jgi:urate oxidase
VLKTTGSAFEGFIRDEFTTLKEVSDRIFSTSIEITCEFRPLTITEPSHSDEVQMDGKVKETLLTGNLSERVRRATLEVFARDESASVQVRGMVFFVRERERRLLRKNQATLYKMAEKVLEENGDVEAVSYVLPNKHYVPVEMGYIGIGNMERLSYFFF